MICMLLSILKPTQTQSSKKAIELILSLYPELKATGPPPVKPAVVVVVATNGDYEECRQSAQCISKCCSSRQDICVPASYKAANPKEPCEGEIGHA